MPIEGDPTANTIFLLDWIAEVVAFRLDVHFGGEGASEFPAFTYREDGSWLPRFLAWNSPTLEELAVVALALLPHLKPWSLDAIIARRLPEAAISRVRRRKGASHRGILPTGETAQFVLAGDDSRSG